MFIVSKASQDNEYVIWETTPNGMKKVKKSILIKGGAGVINKTSMEAPAGVVNEISKEDYELLKEHSAFQRHLANGFMEVLAEEKKAKESAKKKGKRDNSSQLVPEDFEEKGQKAPVVNKN